VSLENPAVLLSYFYEDPYLDLERYGRICAFRLDTLLKRLKREEMRRDTRRVTLGL